MSHTSASSATALIDQTVRESRTWFIVLGILLILLGVGAIAFPLMTTIAVKVMIGWLFLIGGIVQIVHAFSSQKWGAFFLSLLVGVLYVVAGGWLAFFPLTGVLTLTIFLAAMFVVQGILEIVMAVTVRRFSGWLWMLISGILAVVLGFMIFSGLPGTAAWVIGLIVGIDLLSSGAAYLSLGLFAGR